MLPQVVGEGRCPIVDTWWQTETGSIAITPLPGAWPAVPGSATLPFFGIRPVILDDKARAAVDSCGIIHGNSSSHCLHGGAGLAKVVQAHVLAWHGSMRCHGALQHPETI